MGEVEPTTSGEIEYRSCDFSIGGFDFGERFLETLAMEYDQHRARICG